MSSFGNALTCICFLTIISTSFAFRNEGRIAYGKNAEPHSAPYMVSIQVPTRNGSYQHSCGGSIIDKNWILTAAHCLHNPEIAKLQVIKAGRHNIKANTEKYAQTRNIKYYINHSMYKGGVAPFDIALIYLDKPLQFNKGIKPIQLPRSNITHCGIATLFGWGLLENGKFPDILQTTNIPILSQEKCIEIFGGVYHSSNMCTLDDAGNGSCSSDSGGPLVQLNKKNKKVEQIGIVSYGPKCGQPGESSTAYVRVSYFIEWIAKVQNEYNSTL